MKHTTHPLTHKALSLFMALVLMLSLAVPGAAAVIPAAMNPTDDPALGTKFPVAATICLATKPGGQNVTVSISPGESGEGSVNYALSQALQNDKLSITLTRDVTKPYVNEALFPNAYQGGDLKDWRTSNGRDPQFVTNYTVNDGGNGGDITVRMQANTVFLDINLHVNNFFGTDYSVPHTNGGYYIDRCGYYTLTLHAGADGSTEYSTTVKIVPYEGFNTMWEIYKELDSIVTTGTANGLYVQKLSMGQSTAGRDMPYLIVADSQQSVANWLALTQQAENDPAAVLDMINSGALSDIRVPVLYSNVHSNETAASDGVLAFAQMLVSQENISYRMLTGFTEAGQAQLASEMGPVGAAGSVAVPDLIADKATYLGYLTAGNRGSGVVALDTYYTSDTKSINVKNDLLSDVFFILVPEENVDGRTYLTRHSSNGYDLNRDNSFQTTSETINMQQLIGTYNPLSFAEFHGRVKGFQCEPCDPPHEPNFEYDLLGEHLVTGGEALGIGAVANNGGYNSYVMPQRDYLSYTGNGTDTYWSDPWDDMSTSYTPQFAMLHGTVSYTVELPAYNDYTVDAVKYGILAQSAYVGAEKLGYLKDQVTIFQRGVTNANSNATVGPWLTDQYDVEGAEADIFRPVYAGAGQNGNFYPECYIIPLDAAHQTNLQAASDMMAWLTRNDVKVNVTTAPFTYDGVTYPAGTMIIPMYQAKRSVANGALYDGTLINGWTVLYSEGITTFNETRGFDMVTVAEPAAYAEISAVCGIAMDYAGALAYLSSFTSSFSGVTAADVILSNASEDSTSAVNALLKAGKTVGMVTSGQYKGDFICSYADYLTVADRYILTATGVYGASHPAQIISGSPVVYLTGEPGTNSSGFLYNSQVTNASNWNYDRIAMELMNFTVTSSLSGADAIVGASSLTTAETAAVQSGMPYIGYNCAGIRRWNAPFDGVTLTMLSGAMDCLMPVTYPNETLVNASYIADGDDILYGYGLGYFSQIPEGAVALVTTDGSRTPTEGFIPLTHESQQTTYAAFLNGGVQGFSYQENGMDIVLFANTLTNKVHQRDEYAFISNFLFSSALSDESYKGVTDPGSIYVPIITPSFPKPSVKPNTPETPETPEAPAMNFTDVPASSYYADAVAWAVENGITTGTTATTFAPDDFLTRAQAITFLWRAAGEPAASAQVSFLDVDASAYYAKAVAWAVENGITTGTSATTFAPNANVTREQAVAFLFRFAASQGMDAVTLQELVSSFADADTVSPYALSAMNWAIGQGILQGSGNMISPKADCTRGQFTTFLWRAAK